MLKPNSALRKDRYIYRLRGVETLQRRHYAAIAGIIANLPQDTTREDVAKYFATVLAANPRFDRARFLAAALNGVAE